MKSGPALWCALSFLLGSVTCPGIEKTAAAPAPPPPAITADDQFFVDHPDLIDEADVVAEASNALALQRYSPGTAKEASDALAAQCHATLADRTPLQWKQKAVSLYPALGVARSELNLLFIKHYRELTAAGSAFSHEPSWPVLLAKRCDDELRAQNQPAAPIVAKPPLKAASPAPHPDDKNPVRQTHRSGRFWQNFFSLLFLILLAPLPGAFVFRKALMLPPASSKQTPAPGNTPPIWRAALKHAAIIYVVVALPTSIHSLLANSDLGFIDRLFVSLLVGLLFGVFITLPLYGIDTLWQACQKHPARTPLR